MASNETTEVTSRAELLGALRAVLPSQPGLAVIHSSLSGLVAPGDVSRWDFLAALQGLVAQGWTIALPAFTFSFCGGKPFDLQSSASEVGILADWALTGLAEARRTPHPIYSFVVAGPLADRLASLNPLTTFGEGSLFQFFEREGASLVMLGCDWKYCTQFHRYEEIAGVPYRYFKDFSGQVRMGRAEQSVVARMFVRDLQIDPENDFSPAVGALRSQGAIATRQLWRGKVEATTVAALAAVCNEQLGRDVLAHVTNAPEIAFRLAKRKEAASLAPLRVAVLGHSNMERLQSALETKLGELLAGRRVEYHTVPFGQLPQEILNPASDLVRFSPDVSIFVDRLEDLAASTSIETISADALKERVTSYGELIQQHVARHKGWTIVFRFAHVSHPLGSDGPHFPAMVERLNDELGGMLAGIDQLVWLDVAGEASRATSPVTDSRLWFMGRFPYSEPFSQRLARRCAGLILAAIGKSVRLIALDLDNTLWGGVLGEDGLEGVHLGGDYPGNIFVDFQRALKRLAARGIALAIVSKNDTDLALKMLDEHPAMEIRTTDVASHRINWQPKWQNIQEICEELSLGLESVLLIDDNRVEREQMRRNLPAVKVLELPDDPAGYTGALEECPWLDAVSVTAEDLKRADSYRKRSAIEQQRRKAVNLEEFYASLGMTLHFQPLDSGNMSRAAQLSQKTNQFNTTTRRYDKSQLMAIAAGGGEVLVIGLEDKYSAAENIGLIILKPHPERRGWGVVDDLLLSCRILGRGLEPVILHWALTRALRRGWNGLGGFIIETERNTPVRTVFKDAGFLQEASSGEWIRASDQAPAIPNWLLVNEDEALERNTGTATSRATR
jgi:FkbH-like protein